MANFIQNSNVNQTLNNFKPSLALAASKEPQVLNPLTRAGSQGKEKENLSLQVISATPSKTYASSHS